MSNLADMIWLRESLSQGYLIRLLGICWGKGEGKKGKETQNPLPFTLRVELQKYIFARGL
ncbi:MAG: hypothetical protein RM368_15130 [Nostoc sp. DedSLP03]|uniref:hypothetical protein n=1 Tax=Nostoc sp. DedSLP03 TaxID=3075400 RepID=UPI002AD53FAE|nr:hypothetical protein [Nostoc sp. DedSLP03]MDZ7966286.1 hypothetical protein [Nostoc sp. DedSLP03]